MKFKKFNEFKEELKSSEVEQIDEGLKDTIKKALDKGADFAKSVWDGIKRESKETKEAVRILSDMTKGNEVTDVQKKFVKAQAVDLVKILPLVIIQGIPVPIPITPFLLMLGNRVGIDLLPNSHTKVDYPIK